MKNTISQKVSSKLKNYKGGVKNSLLELFKHGTTCTGESGYSRGRAHKSVWTAETIKAANEVGLVVHSGNSSPRGGASGEWVKLIEDKRKNKLAHQSMSLFKRYLKLKEVRREKTAIADALKWQEQHEQTISLFEAKKTEIVDELRIKYPDLILSNKDANSAAWHIGNKFFKGKFKQTTLRGLIHAL